MRSVAPAWLWLSVGLILPVGSAGCKPPPSTPSAAQPGAATAPGSGGSGSTSGGSAAAAPAPAGPAAPIQPPIAMSRPPLPTFGSEGIDTSNMGKDQILSSARVTIAQDKPKLAAALMRMAVEKGSMELYELARYESRARNIDQAIFWLQEAALREGVDAARAGAEVDLENLRADSRWTQLRPFLAECQNYWSNSGIDDHQLVLPANYQGAPLPLLIWLHGENDCAASFAFPQLQQVADRYQVAFVSASGPAIGGPRHFAWSDDMQANDARIASALEKFAGKLKVEQDRVVLAGFSQGAFVAGELAARNPQRYAGALIMSPTAYEIPAANVQPTGMHRRQTVIAVCGTDEGLLAETKGYAEWFRVAGADVTFDPYPDVKVHALVSNFAQRLPEWTAKLLKVQPAMP